MNSLYSAATGMTAQQLQLDVIANNLANVNTSGFKSSRVGFEDLLYQQVGSRQAIRLGSQIGMGSAATSTTKNLTQGTLISTEVPTNIAIDGRGFFQIQVGEELAYTRAGDFKVDASGQLVTSAGFRLVPPVQVPAGVEGDNISISPAGVVTARINGAPQQIAILTLADFINPAGLEAIGNTAFKATVNSGPPVVAQPGTAGVGFLVHGQHDHRPARLRKRRACHQHERRNAQSRQPDPQVAR
jgi:flagellar basal-body rod protein FlgG